MKERSNAVVVAWIGVLGAILAAVIPLYLTGTLGHHPDGSTTPDPRSSSSTGSSQSISDLSQPASLFLSKESAPGGATVLVSGTGFEANERVVIRVHTYLVASPRANSSGAFANVSITVPTDLSKFAPQQFVVTGTGDSSVKTGSATIEVSG
jgi:hypothetical protein